jgi:hypothetical protein
MSSDKNSGPSRREEVVVVLLMVAMTAWYAWPQVYYSLIPLFDIWRSLPR